jgi:hypothetical protein
MDLSEKLEVIASLTDSDLRQFQIDNLFFKRIKALIGIPKLDLDILYEYVERCDAVLTNQASSIYLIEDIEVVKDFYEQWIDL